MSIFRKLLALAANIGKKQRIHWLGVKKTFEDVLSAYPLDKVEEGDAVFLTREHECKRCEGDYDSHWDQSIGIYVKDEHPGEPDHDMGNIRFKAVVKDGKWTRVRIPWRNY